jgi:hypothetical protein
MKRGKILNAGNSWFLKPTRKNIKNKGLNWDCFSIFTPIIHFKN